MIQPVRFDEVLDQVERLSDDDQSQLIDLVRRRLAERGRQRLIQDVQEGIREHAEGKSKVTSVEDLMREIKS